MYDYIEQYSKDHDDTAIDKALDLYQENLNRRHEELFLFINDFVNSEEYEQYLEAKMHIRKRTVFTQYSLSDLRVQEIVPKDKYPLTTQSRKMFKFMQSFDKYIKKKNHAESVKKQERGIKIIKDKITEYRCLYESSKDKMFEFKENEENKILEKFCGTHQIDLSTLSLDAKNKIRDKVVCYQKIKHSQNIRTRNNVLNIVRKLTEEYKRKKEANKPKQVRKRKVVRRKQMVNIVEANEEKLSLPSLEDAKPEVTEEEETEIEGEEEETTTKKITTDEVKREAKKSKKETTPVTKQEEGTKTKQSKKNEKVKSKKTETGRKQKEEEYELVIPPIPLCNLRHKIGPENCEKLLELLKHFEHLENVLEQTYRAKQKIIDKNNFYDSTNFIFKPTTLMFKDYCCHRSYKKRFKIINTGAHIQKLRISETRFENPYDALLFKIQPLFGIQKLPKGCSLQLTIVFTPLEYRQIDGNIIFVACTSSSKENQQFRIPIHCIPCYFDFKIHPLNINFGKIPIWRANTSSFKNLKITNNSKNPCTVVIKKILDPLKLDSKTSSVGKFKYKTKLGKREMVSDILEECLENVFSTFRFEKSVVKLNDFDEIKLYVTFKNFDYVGNYFEKYYFDVYETCKQNVIEHLRCQEILVSAETTDYFISVSPEVLDFGICILNSIYQLSCHIYNNSSITQTVILKFPSNMTEYIKSDLGTLYIPSLATRRVWLKFLPRKNILNIQMYYDKMTSILEFPMHICVLSKTYPDIPPVKTTIFAVLSEQKRLHLKPTVRQLCYYLPDAICLNLGECSIYETIKTYIQLTNHTLAPQIYGFTNIPQCVTITPNYGFGEIMPHEKKMLTLYFIPDYTDAMDSLTIEGTEIENVTNFRINLETVSFLGQCKKEFNSKEFKKTVAVMLKELRNQEDNKELIHDIEMAVYYIKINLFSQDVEDEELPCRSLSDSEDSLQPKTKNIEARSRYITQLWLTAKIRKPLVEFSHQYIQCPDTPCGSTSIIRMKIRAIKYMDFLKKSKSQYDYQASFKIHGGDQEFTIEPACGSLKSGETKKLTLIVSPNIPEDVILNTARSLKYTEVYEQKKQEYERNKRKHSNKHNKSDTQAKAGNEKSKKRSESLKEAHNTGLENKTESDFSVSETDLVVDYLDFYPAEMLYWRNLEPYTIQSEFACTINYDCINMTRKPETIYFNAVCKVVKPDFITNLKLQRIDFGNVVIGMRKCDSVIVQNIQYHPISLNFNVLNPVGPFELLYMKYLQIPPEHYLEIPLRFEPQKEGKVEEYLQIRSGATSLSIILQGTGEAPNIDISPEFLVCRLSTKPNNLAQYPVEVRNKNDFKINITVEKVFELEGHFKEIEIEQGIGEADKVKDKERKASKTEKARRNTKEGKKESGVIQDKRLLHGKFSNELTEAEEAALRECFKKKTGEFCYDVINMDESTVEITPNCTKVINFAFGMPTDLLAKKQQLKQKIKEKRKNSNNDKITNDPRYSRASRDSKKIKGHAPKSLPDADQVYHVAKYNIMLNKIFLKDIIFISTFT